MRKSEGEIRSFLCSNDTHDIWDHAMNQLFFIGNAIDNSNIHQLTFIQIIFKMEPEKTTKEAPIV